MYVLSQEAIPCAIKHLNNVLGPASSSTGKIEREESPFDLQTGYNRDCGTRMNKSQTLQGEAGKIKQKIHQDSACYIVTCTQRTRFVIFSHLPYFSAPVLAWMASTMWNLCLKRDQEYILRGPEFCFNPNPNSAPWIYYVKKHIFILCNLFCFS